MFPSHDRVGVQSTTLALMIEKGEIPMVDCAIFSDVKGEPQKVYEHLDWLEKQLSYPLHRVTWRDLKQDVLDASVGKYKGFTAPFYTLDESGKKRCFVDNARVAINLNQ